MNAETVTYSYNVRGWLTGISSTHFTETLAYNTANGSLYPSVNRWGGNIGAMSWKAGNESTTRTYKFSYNSLNRLTAAAYTGTGNYSTEYTYDKMGNFQTMKRYGLQDGGTYGLIDNLTFTLNGNQVTKIEDAVNDPTYNGCFNFVDGSSASTEYEYDKNGNLTKDLNKKISSIQYNLLNLPQIITYRTNKSATYTYDAEGNKLRVVYTNPGSTIDYCGNMIYEGGTLKQILVDGGYVTLSGSTPTYHYYLQDHLGNNRVVCNASGTVEQVNHYYPFGGLFGENTNGDTQYYKYNGKEFDRMHGLDWYDYRARQMDAMRFTTMDPLAEKYYSISPYAYCGNNPVNCVDLNGDSISVDYRSILAIYNGLLDGTKISMKFNNGVLDPTSISNAAHNSNDTFLRDLYEIATNSQMVELKTTDNNQFVMDGKLNIEEWGQPQDFNVEQDYSGETLKQLLKLGYQKGKTITGNLGQTLYPAIYNETKTSTNGVIQININSRGTLNHQSVGIAHEFAHVILFLRGLPHSHSKNGDFIYNRQFNVMKRFGYDYVDW